MKWVYLFICLFVATAAFSQEPQVACAPTELALKEVSARKPIAAVAPVPAYLIGPLRDWLNDQEPKSTEQYDLILVLAHTTDEIGLAFGWQRDPHTGKPSLCGVDLLSGEGLEEVKAIVAAAKPKDEQSF